MTEYKQLYLASAALNGATDKLRNSINELEQALTIVSPGVPAWVSVEAGVSLGYVKAKGVWRLQIKNAEHVWNFNEAPRHLRLDAVNYIPDLLAQLSIEAATMLARTQAQVEEVSKITQAISYW